MLFAACKSFECHVFIVFHASPAIDMFNHLEFHIVNFTITHPIFYLIGLLDVAEIASVQGIFP